MLRRSDAIKMILEGEIFAPRAHASAFAPANLALVKYWGKRDIPLNLPMTSSFSIAMGEKGTRTKLLPLKEASHLDLILNGKAVSSASKLHKRLEIYLKDFPFWNEMGLKVITQSNLPIGAGLASSSSGFAAFILALDQLFDWQLEKKDLSILARMGSGSAARSFWPGFALWHRGEREDGMDSFAEIFNAEWKALRIALLLLEGGEKPIGSTEAMNRTVETSQLYRDWPRCVASDLITIQSAILKKDFKLFGETLERNADFMHATMRDAMPSVDYNLPATHGMIKQIKALRAGGLSLYYTQDAGPNLKLFFLEADQKQVEQSFQQCEIISPFGA